MSEHATLTPERRATAKSAPGPTPGPAPLRPAANRALLLLGLFQVVVGAALLMVPHRFTNGPFEGWLDRPIAFGALGLLAGVVVLWIRVLPVRRSPVVFAGLSLTAVNVGLALAMNADAGNGHWLVFFATTALAALVLLCLMAGGRETLPAIGVGPSFSIAVLMSQVAAIGTGVLMLGFPIAYATDVFDDLRPLLLPVGGALWLLGGVLSAANLLVGRTGARVQAVGNALLGAVWVVVAVPLAAQGSWFGVVTSATLALAAWDRTALGPRRWAWSPTGALAMNSARRRVILTSATASLATALGLTLALATYQEASLRNQLEQEQQRAAAALTGELDTYLRAMINGIDIAADFVEVQSLDPAQMVVPLGDVAWDWPELMNVAVVDTAGNEIYRSDGRPLSNVATDPAVRRALGGALNAFGQIRANQNTGQPTLTLATALFSNESRRQVGAVVAELPLTAINGFVQGLPGADEYGYIVVGSDGLLISHPDSLALAQRDTFALTSAVERSLDGGSGTVLASNGAERVLTGFATMPAPWSWGVLVEKPERLVVADIQAARDQTLALLGVATVAVVALSLFLAYVVLKPAADLVAPVSAVGEGRWDVELPEADDSELGALIRAFGQMRRQIFEREEELVRRNEELSAARLKGQFLMTMTHELRSPMDGILGYGHLLLDGVDGDLTPEQAADVAQITASAEQLLQLINNVLDFSLLESGEMHLSPAPTDVGSIIEGLRGQFALAAAKKGIALTIDLQPALPQAMVEGESVKKILGNLVDNAIKFTESGQVTIGAFATEERVEVSVKDTGIGIPAEALDLIFEEFRQVDSSLNRQYGGAGLGLAIARRLAELQGVDVVVTSQLGLGTTFTVRLPRVVVRPVAFDHVDRGSVSALSEVGRRLARLRVLQQSAPVATASIPPPAQSEPYESPIVSGSRASGNGRY